MEWVTTLATLVGPLIGAAVVVIGWRRGNELAALRDQENKRRELRLEMTLAAYHALTASTRYRPLTGDPAREVEKALESIQLLGTPAQIDLAQQAMAQFEKHSEADWQPLLQALRTSLRQELGIERASETLLHLHIGGGAEGNPSAQRSGKSGSHLR